jgi:uncharacterized protein (TIGR02284 family)
MSNIHEGVTLGEGGPTAEPLVERALEHLIDIVNGLVRREIATAAALETAAERLDAADLAQLALALEAGHRDHIGALSSLVTDLGGEPAESSSLRSFIDRARVRLHELTGDDGILEALANIEVELTQAYHDAVATVGFTDDERAILLVALSAAEEAAGVLRGARPR